MCNRGLLMQQCGRNLTRWRETLAAASLHTTWHDPGCARIRSAPAARGRRLLSRRGPGQDHCVASAGHRSTPCAALCIRPFLLMGIRSLPIESGLENTAVSPYRAEGECRPTRGRVEKPRRRRGLAHKLTHPPQDIRRQNVALPLKIRLRLARRPTTSGVRTPRHR